MNKESWKDTGNCCECKRNKYCKKRCRANILTCMHAVLINLAQMQPASQLVKNMPRKDDSK